MTDRSERFSLKDALFNEPKVRQLAGELSAVHSSFPAEDFVATAVERFPDLELKARIAWLTECLRRFLPGDFRDGLAVILSALPPELDPDRSDDDFGDFIHAPYGEYVAHYGCTDEHLAVSLDALHQITRRFSAEGAIRPFLNAYPDVTLATLMDWATDANYHVRRLCSEGTRPLLPWNMRLSIPYTAPIPILDQLHADPTRYVTRSVANHLNDVAKLDPDLAIGRLRDWQRADVQRSDELRFMTNHALRTLIKQGHPEALELIGVVVDAPIRLTGFAITPEVAIGDSVTFSFDLESPVDCEALVDFAITFAGPGGKPGGRKMFKLRRISLAAGVPVSISKAHPLRGGMTTRTLYPGEHRLEVQVNGAILASGPFLLRAG